MKFHLHITGLLAAALLLTRCNFSPKPIDVDIEAPPPQLVVSSYAIPPSIFAVAVTRTFSGLFDEDDVTGDSAFINNIIVDSALVVVRYNGRADTLFKLTSTLFGSISVEQIPNQRYELYVKDYKTGQEVTAETVFLETVPLDSARSVLRLSNSGQDTTHTFRYRFTDRPNEENYYLATYTLVGQDSTSALDSLPGNIFDFQLAYFNIFTDYSNGDGQSIAFEPLIPDIGRGDTVAIALSNIPKDYYEYLAAYKRSGNLFSSFLAEPISLPTNVQNGYGYFVMLRPSVRFVVLE